MYDLGFELVVALFKAIFYLLRGVFQSIRGLVRVVTRRMKGAHDSGPGGGAPAPARMTLAKPAAPGAKAPPPAADRAAIARLISAIGAINQRARPLAARCDAERLCEPLRPTLRDFVLPRLAQAESALRGNLPQAAVTRLGASIRYLDGLTRLLEVMAEQRRDPALDELIDDADALAAACYRPVLEYCRNVDIPLSSDRTATLFGDGCSPALGRIDDPTGLALLHLPWEWLSEVHRWPAIGHEVGHDFYDSVRGLDEELLRRTGLDEADSRVTLVATQDVTLSDVARIVRRWRHELAADAFGAMMLGPAYAVATAAIFADPEDPGNVLSVDVDGNRYDVHPPGQLRVAAVCRLLVNMGFGAQCEEIEKRWRAQHRNARFILLPTGAGIAALNEDPFIEQAVAFTTTLQREGHAALKGIPLYSMPGFDFGPREHVASRRIRDAFLAGEAPGAADARLLIAGAVLAWAERPKDSQRILRAARLAVGNPPAAGASSRWRARASGGVVRRAGARRVRARPGARAAARVVAAALTPAAAQPPSTGMRRHLHAADITVAGREPARRHRTRET